MKIIVFWENSGTQKLAYMFQRTCDTSWNSSMDPGLNPDWEEEVSKPQCSFRYRSGHCRDCFQLAVCPWNKAEVVGVLRHPPLWDAAQLPRRLIISALRVPLRNLGILKPAFQQLLGVLVLSHTLCPSHELWCLWSFRADSQECLGNSRATLSKLNRITCSSVSLKNRFDFSVVLLETFFRTDLMSES